MLLEAQPVALHVPRQLQPLRGFQVEMRRHRLVLVQVALPNNEFL